MLITWKNKMIEQGFNYADSTIKEMTDFFETAKKAKKATKKRKREDSDSNVVESRKESTPSKK